ncbi:MAG: hypothetical protein AABY22_10040 [Nanoarchaeota archaeon]
MLNKKEIRLVEKVLNRALENNKDISDFPVFKDSEYAGTDDFSYPGSIRDYKKFIKNHKYDN